MRRGIAAIVAGLGTRHSNGIIVTLKRRLEIIPGMFVLAGSPGEWDDFAVELRNSTADFAVIIGHSLGGSVAPEMARRAEREIAAIFGFDPADNIAANASEYRLTPVPANVKIARAGFVKNSPLGGGQYTAENLFHPTNNPLGTHIENFEVPEGHLDADDAIARHFEIEEFCRRQTEVQLG